MTDTWWLNPCKAIDAHAYEHALARQQRRGQPAGLPAAEFCGEHLRDAGCGDEIPRARRAAVPGCQLCVACQWQQEKSKGAR